MIPWNILSAQTKYFKKATVFGLNDLILLVIWSPVHWQYIGVTVQSLLGTILSSGKALDS